MRRGRSSPPFLVALVGGGIGFALGLIAAADIAEETHFAAAGLGFVVWFSVMYSVYSVFAWVWRRAAGGGEWGREQASSSE